MMMILYLLEKLGRMCRTLCGLYESGLHYTQIKQTGTTASRFGSSTLLVVEVELSSEDSPNTIFVTKLRIEEFFEICKF